MGDCKLFEASYRGDLEAVKCILAAGLADVNCRDRDGRTPMMWAARHGHRGVVEFLVSEGADVTLVDGVSNNILHLACVVGDVKAVKFILSRNMLIINSRGEQNRTPVMVAALCGHGEVVKSLVSEGANVSLVDSIGNNILHLACAGGHARTVKFILSTDMTDIDSKGEQSLTSVMVAALFGHRDVVELLVNEGADVSLVDDGGDNILHLACVGGDLNTVKFILSRNMVDINSRGSLVTPVMLAAQKGHTEIVKFLVSEVTDLSLVDDDGDSILHWACVGGDVNMVKFILSRNMVDINSRGSPVTPVMLAAQKGHTEIVKFLVSEVTDLSLVDDDGDSILHWACAGGDVNMVKFILSRNMVDINSRGWWGTPVMLAAQNGHGQMVKFLVRNGAEMSHVTKRGNTILNFACVGGDEETMEFVYSQGKADTDARNKKEQTAE
ncbi:ankyrin repeat domain-containing protein 17-like [Haliotis rufescens]|uniref:ankyrin repeat domain-containing protein 17-like n=1 Tax=Haliotis rufescens TaxID=6454 RepID=UPI00201ED59B|nr:ankyrin repeat domain-containing protein 17-like [Haliotis rufescens]